jgi:hypothetical protein
MIFRFGCPVCVAPLETDTSESGRPTTCPTCGQAFPIPHLDPASRRVIFDPVNTPKRPAESMAYLHAYACAGRLAPTVVRDKDGRPHIRCSRCGLINPPTSDWCLQCRVPFTVQSGTTPAERSRSNPLATVSLVLGVASWPMLCFPVVAVAGVVCGAVALYQIHNSSGDRTGSVQASIGLVLSLLSGGLFAVMVLF